MINHLFPLETLNGITASGPGRFRSVEPDVELIAPCHTVGESGLEAGIDAGLAMTSPVMFGATIVAVGVALAAALALAGAVAGPGLQIEREQADALLSVQLPADLGSSGGVSASVSTSIRNDSLTAWILSLRGLSAPAAAIQLQRRMNAELVASNFPELADALASVDVTQLETIVVVGLLRSTFAARQHLQSWEGFARHAYAEIERRGEDAQTLLRGLIGGKA